MFPLKSSSQAQEKASAIADRKPENYWLRRIWLGFLIAYPIVITLFTFCMVWLDSVGFIGVKVPVLMSLIGKTAATDIGIISYAAITKNLFPSPSFTKILVE